MKALGQSPASARVGEVVSPREMRALRLPVLSLLWLVSLVPHLALAIVFYSYPIGLDDMYQYDMLARSLVQGRGYRWYAQADVETLRPYLQQFMNIEKVAISPEGFETTFRAPGYPFFLAGLYRLVPPEARFGMVRLVQAGLLSLLAPGAALLAVNLGARRKTAILSGVGMALYPILWFYPAGLATENLFIPLMLFALLALLRAARSQSAGYLILAGLLLGAAMLTRSILAIFVLLAAAWMVRFGRVRWSKASLILLVAFGLCLPWAVRNSRLAGRPEFVESALSYQMYVGYHPNGNGSFRSDIAIPPLTILDDAQREQYCTTAVIGFLRANPLDAAWRVVRRGAFFFGAEDRELMYFYSNDFFGEIAQPWLSAVYLGLILPWVAVLLFAPLGWLFSAQRPAAWLVLALIVGYTLPHLLVIAEPRFHLALVPVLLPLAAIGWDHRREAWETSRQLKTGQARAWLAGGTAVVLLAFLIWGFALHWDRLAPLLAMGGNHVRLGY